jgi:hypothetical protein
VKFFSSFPEREGRRERERERKGKEEREERDSGKRKLPVFALLARLRPA